MITYEQAKEIVKLKGELKFYESIKYIDGYKISMFNYRLPFYDDFFIGDLNATEMRGLCFVFNLDGSLYKKYIMLQKFWNINQVEETQYDKLKDLQIKDIYTKEDGTLITFIQLPNGRILPKTKASLDCEQAIEAQNIYNNNVNIQNLVKYCLNNNLSPLFEYVSFKNKIVLDYIDSSLILLKVRNNDTGKYIDIDNFYQYNVDIVKKEQNYSLDELILKSETEENKEGWVITFVNDYMIKIKTKYYFIKHRLLTEDLNRENDIIRLIIENKLDDVISQLDDNIDKERIAWIKSIENKISFFITNKIKDIDKKYEMYLQENDHVQYVYKNKKDKDFHFVMSVSYGKDKYEVLYEYILKNTHHLMQAKSFLNKIKI